MSTIADPTTALPPQVSAFADLEKFSERLRQACKLAGVEWGQTALADALGAAKQTVDRWMGDSQPKADKLFEIADRLKVDPRWLATGQGEMQSAANDAPQHVSQRTGRTSTKEVRPHSEHSTKRNTALRDNKRRQS